MTGSSRHPATLLEAELLAECQTRQQRRRGPGGQHRNKVETAVIVTHLPTGMQGAGAERRSQEQNRRMAIFRLRVKLAIHVRRPVDLAAYEPSAQWRGRCVHRRISINPEHPDFPALLAEALDVLAAVNWEPTVAAARMGCSPSQLVKLLHLEPPALAMLNQQRLACKLHPLR